MIKKEIKIFGKMATLTMRNDGDYAIASELFLEHQYRLCDEVIRRAKHTIIDIGGHLGFFSLYAALLNPTVPIYTFEPHSGNYQILKENLKNNHVKNVFPKNLAVDKWIKEVPLYLSKEDLNHSTVEALEPTGEVQPVQTITLEKIFQKFKIDTCDLVKIDCEGAESDILYGTPPPIFSKIRHLFIEYHDWISGHDSKELMDFLKKKGFRVEKYPNPKMKELGLLWCKK